MTAFTRVDVVSDTPEWLEERRGSVGASEVPAIMGLSKWATPLDVYKSKHGIDRPFDPILSFIGHQSESIIEAWVHQFADLHVTLEPGFMARSITHPFLHASFDRVSHPFLTWQFKTAHHYTGHEWNEGIPTDIRVQVQAEMAVAGTERAGVVVWIGGREFKLFWEQRDERFIREHLIPTVEQFWVEHVQAGVPPEPATLTELNEVELDPGSEVEASETALEMIERRAVLLSDIQAQQAEADALKLALGNYMGTAETLTKDGRKILTFKYQKGRESLDTAALKQAHPDLVTEFTRPGSPYRVMRTIKQKEAS